MTRKQKLKDHRNGEQKYMKAGRNPGFHDRGDQDKASNIEDFVAPQCVMEGDHDLINAPAYDQQPWN